MFICVITYFFLLAQKQRMSELILDLLSTVALCIKHFVLCEGSNISTVAMKRQTPRRSS